MMATTPTLLLLLLDVIYVNFTMTSIQPSALLSEGCVSVCVCVCDSAVSCAVAVIEMVVKNFATLINTTVSGPPPSNVDIAAEERLV